MCGDALRLGEYSIPYQTPIYSFISIRLNLHFLFYALDCPLLPLFILMLKLSQRCPVGIPSSCLWCPFHKSPSFFECFLSSRKVRKSMLILYFSCPGLESVKFFSGSPGSLKLRTIFRNQDLRARCAPWYWCGSQTLLVDRVEKYVHACLHIQLHLYLHICLNESESVSHPVVSDFL